MIPRIGASLDRLQGQKTALIEELSTRSSTAISRRLTPETWSMLDVAEHIMEVERAFGEAVKTNLSRPPRPVRAQERIKAFIVLGVMRSPLKVRTPPSASQVLPKGKIELPELVAEWDRVRQHLETLAAEISPKHLRLGVFRHPVSGFMTPVLGFAFLNEHFRHHGYQLARLIRQV